MGEKFRVETGQVQETLLVPLYGRAVETRKRRGLLRDPLAVQMVEAIDYDFTKFDSEARSLFGSVLRTLIFDDWVKRFLTRYPAGTVVELGAGLNTRFERLDNGTVHWVDVDLPDVVELRRRFMTDSERRLTVAGSALDPGWLERVRAMPGPFFVATEAVLLYLGEPGARRALSLVTQGLPGAWIALDTATSRMIESQARRTALGKMDARMTWACEDPRALEQWGLGLRVRQSRSLAELPAAVRASAPWRIRAALALVSMLLPSRSAQYRVALLQHEPLAKDLVPQEAVD
ncbi:MAG: class I SAM-dependent methyltransferase [Egibacteraceae bacterium]